MATEGVTVANAFVQVMPSMEGATDNITKAILPGIEGAGSQAGAMFGNIFSGAAGTAIKALGGALVGLFAFDKMADAYSEVEAGLNNLKIATGATGEAAKGLEDAYLNVSKNVVGSFEDIGSAVGEINTRLGLEGEELEKASEAMMKYAKVTGQDATQATQDVASMMRNVGIPSEELADTLGKLTVAGQKAGIDVSSLANNVTKYNSVMKQLGLSTDEQIALMAKFEVSGADTATILNAMKRGVAEWAKEGKDARAEFENFVTGVQDGSVTAGDAVEIFGSRGGLSMYEAAQKGQLSFEDMYDAISNASEKNLDDIYQDTLTAGEKFDLLGKNLQAGFFEIMEPIVDAISPFIDDFVSIVSGAISVVVSIVTPFFEMIGAALTQLRAWLAPIWSAIQDNINNVVIPAIQAVTTWVGEQLTPIINKLADWINTYVVPAFTQLADFVMTRVVPDLQKLGAWVAEHLQPIFEWFANILFNYVVPALGEVVGWIISNVVPAIETAYDWISDNIIPIIQEFFNFVDRNILPIFDAIADFITGSVVPALSSLFGWINDNIVPVFQTFADVLSTVFGWLQDVVQAISDAIGWINKFNSTHTTYRTYDADPWGSGYYGYYATGGFTEPGELYVANERGGEFIWPSYEPYMSKYADALASRIGRNNGVDIHGCTFNVRRDSDIRKVAEELNTLINRQTVGGLI